MTNGVLRSARLDGGSTHSGSGTVLLIAASAKGGVGGAGPGLAAADQLQCVLPLLPG